MAERLYSTLHVDCQTRERANRLSDVTGLPIIKLVEKVLMHWEIQYVARMTPREVKRYMSGKMTFTEGQQIAWRPRQQSPPPIPDDPAPEPSPPLDDAMSAPVAEPQLAEAS